MPAEKGVRYPLCLEGERACPPDDVGGTYGYQDYLKAMANPSISGTRSSWNGMARLIREVRRSGCHQGNAKGCVRLENRAVNMTDGKAKLLLALGKAQIDAIFQAQDDHAVDDSEFLPLVEAVLNAFEAVGQSEVVHKLWEYAFDAYDKDRKEAQSQFDDSRKPATYAELSPSENAARDANGKKATLKMEAVILIGIQGAGKSTFYKDRFFNTHVRINLDMLKTRHREKSS